MRKVFGKFLLSSFVSLFSLKNFFETTGKIFSKHHLHSIEGGWGLGLKFVQMKAEMTAMLVQCIW